MVALLTGCVRADTTKMKPLFKTYAAYGVGCALVWALVLAIVADTASRAKRNQIVLVFLGWALGWLSATIARAVYRVPKHSTLAPPM